MNCRGLPFGSDQYGTGSEGVEVDVPFASQQSQDRVLVQVRETIRESEQSDRAPRHAGVELTLLSYAGLGRRGQGREGDGDPSS